MARQKDEFGKDIADQTPDHCGIKTPGSDAPQSAPPLRDNQGYEGLVCENAEHKTLRVLISGATCAMCIQKIESSLNALPDIDNARLNFSTRCLTIAFDGKAQRANDYVDIVEGLGYGVHPFDGDTEKAPETLEARFLLLCLGVAGFAMGNIMLLSVGVWITSAETMGMAMRDFMHWMSAMIGVPAVMFSGRPFFRSAFKALRGGHTNMDVPISLALVLACGMSIFELLDHGEHVYFDSAVMLTFFLLIGRYLDFRARQSARSAASDLLSSIRGFANVLEDGKIRRVLIRDLQEGMTIRVGAGEKIPVDGKVESGKSAIDTALITGESIPRDVEEGDAVYAGTMNMAAPLTITVSKAANDSLLADIVRLMEKAEQGQAKYVRLADRAAKLYTPVVHSFAAIAFLGWWLAGGLEWQEALLIAVTVLIITCPCALGLAVPVVQVLASGALLKRGILVKSGDALERLAAADTVLLDKTGTLTLGAPALEGSYEARAHQLAASLASHSAHPLSKAMRRSYKGELLELEEIKEVPGQGLRAIYQGSEIKLGSRTWCGVKQEISSSQGLELWLLDKEQDSTVFEFSDPLRADAKEIVSALQSEGLKLVIVSGDRESAVCRVAQDLGISDYKAEQTPPQKYDVLESYKGHGENVLMIGDGLNDAPVLAGADISMAPGSAIDMAQNAADIVFTGKDLAPVKQTHGIAKFSKLLVQQNFALAIIYNIIAVPLALAGMVTPMIAAIAMSGSSFIVIANSFRLKLPDYRKG